MSEYIRKDYNVIVLLYCLDFPAKYRRVIFDQSMDQELNHAEFLVIHGAILREGDNITVFN